MESGSARRSSGTRGRLRARLRHRRCQPPRRENIRRVSAPECTPAAREPRAASPPGPSRATLQEYQRRLGRGLFRRFLAVPATLAEDATSRFHGGREELGVIRPFHGTDTVPGKAALPFLQQLLEGALVVLP